MPSSITDNIYVAYRQYLYTSMALGHLVWKKLTGGETTFTSDDFPEPDCVRDGWNHKFVQLKNIRIHYVEQGPPDAPTLLMIHGFPEFWYSWRFQLKHFEHKYRCIAIDMRGYNESEKPNGASNYRLDLLIDDIRQFIEHLGLKDVTLASHDWGAIVCWRFAMLHPTLIDKLVILNVPHPTAFQKCFQESKEQRDKSWYVFMFQSALIPELVLSSNRLSMVEQMFRGEKAGIRNRANFTDDDVRAWKHVFAQPNALTFPINYYRQMFDAPQIEKSKRFVKPPVLIIWGDADAFLDVRGAHESLKHCDDARLHIIKGASHWVQQDEPEIVNQLIEQFMENRIDTARQVVEHENSRRRSSKL